MTYSMELATNIKERVTILYIGYIFNICKLTLFTVVGDDNSIQFELRDDLKRLPRGSYLFNFQQVSTTGIVDISDYPLEDKEASVNSLVKFLESLYISLQEQAYRKELTHERKY